MELKDYKVGDENKIIELFELVFKQKMSLEQWYWRFAKNPAGQFLIKLMWEEDKLIGHYAVSPVTMMIDGVPTLTAHSLTTMTHPDYGGRGIFKSLSLALYDELENNLGCEAIWGFPNNNSHFGFVKSLGWSNIAVIHTLGISATLITKNITRINIEEFKLFEKHHVDFIETKTNHLNVKVKRSLDYLNWRYVAKPAVSYKKFYVNSKECQAILVTKIYPSSKNGLYDLNLVECHMNNYDYLNECIDFIMGSYDVPFDRATIWKNLFDSDHLLLEKNGFVPVAPQTYLGARIHNSMPSSFYDYKNWYLTMGDSDVY